MVKDFFLGAQYVWRGFALFARPGIFLFALIPVLINVILFSGITWLVFRYTNVLTDSLLGGLPDWLSWLTGLLWLLLTIGVVLVAYLVFTPLANIVAAPFNGPLAERVENVLTGKTIDLPFTLERLLRDARQSVAAELRKLFYWLKFAIPLLLLFLVPMVQFAAPVLWFWFSSWMLAVQYADYPMANHGIYFQDQRKMLGLRPGLAFGFGSVMALLTITPGLNFIALPIGVIGATALWVDQFKADARPLSDFPQIA